MLVNFCLFFCSFHWCFLCDILIFKGLYERDYSQEYQNYYKNGKVVTGRLTELMDVLSRSKLQLEDIPNALNVGLVLNFICID